jgi:Zn-dependent protease
VQPPGKAENREPAIPGSVTTVRAFGIPVRFHFTFVLLLIFLVVVGLEGRQSAWMDVVFVLSLFASVLLHELGHALVGRRYGVRTVEIVMFPIGGVARLARSPKPREELWIASAGPAVNFLIAGVLFLVLWMGHGVKLGTMASLLEPTDSNLLERIAAGNLILAAFNLLPAFPMDGGRILRSLLALYKSEVEATQIAARAGRFLAIAMGLYGLLTMHYMLVFIAFFVYLGATQASRSVPRRSLTTGPCLMAARSAMQPTSC